MLTAVYPLGVRPYALKLHAIFWYPHSRRSSGCQAGNVLVLVNERFE
jgi:hypothetical protein